MENVPSPDAEYLSEAWERLRGGVVARDGHRCRNCGASEKLQVHHWLPTREFQELVDHRGYALTGNRLIVHESGLVTLCRECHEALTTIRSRNAVLNDPRLRALGKGAGLHNVFQLWALNGERLPFRVRKTTWNAKTEQFYVVERIEITRWPYGFAWGRYCRNGVLSPADKIRSAGTYTWIAVPTDRSEA